MEENNVPPLCLLSDAGEKMLEIQTVFALLNLHACFFVTWWIIYILLLDIKEPTFVW